MVVVQQMGCKEPVLLLWFLQPLHHLQAWQLALTAACCCLSVMAVLTAALRGTNRPLQQQQGSCNPSSSCSSLV